MARGLINICRVMSYDGQQSAYLSKQVSDAQAQMLLSIMDTFSNKELELSDHKTINRNSSTRNT